MTSSPNDNVVIADRTRHPNLWFNDGNIILTTDTSVFRVHRGILGMHSSVFDDTFTLPQLCSDEVNPMFDGFPVVEICDADSDFTHLLHFFYDRRYYQRGTETTFDIISGLLRMSTKYQLDGLRAEIISHLALAYPSTLEKYLEAVDPNTHLPLFPPFQGQHFAIVALARETGASALLPAALWRSSCVPPDEIVNGIVDEDSRRTFTLSTFDITLCSTVKYRAVQKYLLFENRLAFLCSVYGHEEPDRCARLALESLISSTGINELPAGHDMLQKLLGYDIWKSQVCRFCEKVSGLQVSRFRKDFWSLLPELFGMPAETESDDIN